MRVVKYIRDVKFSIDLFDKFFVIINLFFIEENFIFVWLLVFMDFDRGLLVLFLVILVGCRNVVWIFWMCVLRFL